jgi:hypothetical protein
MHELGNLKYCQWCGKKVTEDDSFITKRNLVPVAMHKECWKKRSTTRPWENKGIQITLKEDVEK